MSNINVPSINSIRPEYKKLRAIQDLYSIIKELQEGGGGGGSYPPSGGVPKSDLSSSVQASLDKADTAIQYNEVSTNDSGTTDTAITIGSTTIYTTDTVYPLNPGETIKYICQTNNHATYIINAGITPMSILSESNYGEVNYTNETEDIVYVQGACIADGDDFTVHITMQGLNSKENVSNKTSDISTNATSTTKYPSAKGVADYAEAKMAIVAASGATLSAAVNTYYNFASEVGTLAITLPTPTDTTHISNVVFMMTTGSSPAVTFAAGTGIDVIAQDGFSIEASTTYEINAIFNGVAWVVAAMKLSSTPINS